MSVINKMLRDLDQRSASTLDPALRSGTRMATKLQANAPANTPGNIAALWGGIGAALLVMGFAAWWWSRPSSSLPVAVSAASAPQEPLQVVTQPTSQPAVVLPPAINAGVALPASSVVPRPDVPVSSKPVVQATTSIPAVPKAGTSTVESAGLKPSTPSNTVSPAPPPVTAATTAAPVAAATPDPVVTAQRQQNATREVLAQAQALYSSGSADAAIQLLQDTLHSAERATPPAPAAIQLQLVRELARMELAQGRAAAVLELLGRSEPLMAAQPDLWAVRANAAQRLGRHQDALQFYATALQARPAEQRWLLGSAVSQAALGQLVAAADLAEKARAIAPVSKEVLTYLRQQGVALNDKP
jgi:MSHA biogenesis protein MshN